MAVSFLIMRVYALVIGNNDYPDPDKLQNAVADAQAMASVFNRLGYDVAEMYNFVQTDVPGIMSKLKAELQYYRYLNRYSVVLS